MINRSTGGARPAARQMGPGGIGGMLPPQKTKDVGGTLRQLLQRLRPERLWIAISAVLALGSVAFTVIGPKILGNATNVIFDGVIGKMLPAGLSKAQAVAALRARGQNQISHPAAVARALQSTPSQSSTKRSSWSPISSSAFRRTR